MKSSNIKTRSDKFPLTLHPSKARVRQAFFHFDNISLELLEPVGGPSTWKEFLDSNGEGVHHIAFEIRDMDDRISSMECK
jgi:methylmalonyl-CoA/ethylmalonyl-CoA epimerase